MKEYIYFKGLDTWIYISKDSTILLRCRTSPPIDVPKYFVTCGFVYFGDEQSDGSYYPNDRISRMISLIFRGRQWYFRTKELFISKLKGNNNIWHDIP